MAFSTSECNTWAPSRATKRKAAGNAQTWSSSGYAREYSFDAADVRNQTYLVMQGGGPHATHVPNPEGKPRALHLVLAEYVRPGKIGAGATARCKACYADLICSKTSDADHSAPAKGLGFAR